ncbi:MAG: hypothetical protein IPK31_14245 [Chitinophagaceae bacterium]|nr:hypothetical protein [Chitinophagaceae bacterium]
MKSNIKYLLFIAVLIGFSSCNKGFFFDGKKIKAVLITDLGEMYSTYNFSSSEKEELGRQLNNKALIDEITRYSKENTWPDAINTLDERLNSRSTMMKYHFYKVATLGNKTIVSIPKDKNGHMPAGFRPNGPMYMIFASSVVAGK